MEKPSEYLEKRKMELDQMKQAGILVYPKFCVSNSLKQFVEKYKGLKNEERLDEVKENVAGRVMRTFNFGEFPVYELHGGGETILVKTKAGIFGSVKYGDVVGVTGFPGKAKKGNLVIFAESLVVLSPCLHKLLALPKGELPSYSPGSLRDPSKPDLNEETRARSRFVDMILHRDVVHVFQIRSKIIGYLRKFLDCRDFLEVETPIISFVPGVGAGRPFVTDYRNAKHYLRVAPETNLKKVLVGGFDRIYEIGKQFRNEDIDSTHHPEFTSCELYMTYTDYDDMMDLTEELLCGLVKEMTGSHSIKCYSNGENKKKTEIQFTRPFRRVDFINELEEKIEAKIPDDLESEEANAFLKDICERRGVKCKPPQRTARMLDKLADKFLVPDCVQPTFIINHPTVMSLMAKAHESNPRITERFELYVNKQELCNAYSELNDPQEQRRRFSNLLKELNDGEHEATILDEQFCEALEYGLPPTAGWGIGIDRLVMLLTSSRNIKDVMLFPLMRPKGPTRERASANEP